MTREEYLTYRRNLQKRWRHNHPDWVKKSNKKWSDLYRETTPFCCTCVKCGNVFYAARSCMKVCLECRNKEHAHAKMVKEEKITKRKKRSQEIATIIQLHRQGYSQIQIAQKLGRAQSGISVILRTFGIRKKILTRRKKNTNI